MNKQKGNIQLLIIVVLAAVVGYFVYTNYISKQSAAPSGQTTQTLSPTESTSSAETKDWKTYTNNEGGFSLDIPNDVTDTKIGNVLIFTNPDASNLNYTENFLEFYIEIFQNPSKLSPQEYIDKKYVDVPDNQGRGSDFINSVNKGIRDSKESVVVNNIPAVATTHTGFEQIEKAVWIQNDDKIILIRLGGGETGAESTRKAKETFDQILSTFKFTQ